MGKSRVDDMGVEVGEEGWKVVQLSLSLPPHLSRLSSLFSCIASLCPLFSSLLSLLSLPPSLPSLSLSLSLSVSLSLHQCMPWLWCVVCVLFCELMGWGGKGRAEMIPSKRHTPG